MPPSLEGKRISCSFNQKFSSAKLEKKGTTGCKRQRRKCLDKFKTKPGEGKSFPINFFHKHKSFLFLRSDFTENPTCKLRKKWKESLDLLESVVVGSQSLGGDLVLFADLDSGLLQNLEPGVRQRLAHTHPLLRFVNQQIGDEMLGFPGNVLPELEVKIDVTHLDTLEGLPVVL